MLEHQLEEIDATERSPLFLGSSRDDQNMQRSSTLLEIDRALLDYGILSAIMCMAGYTYLLMLFQTIS